MGCKSDSSAGPFSTHQPTSLEMNPAGGTNAAQPVVLSEGDVINVFFPGSASLNTTQQIRRDGKVVLPLVGEVTAAGKTPADLQAELVKLYAPQVATKQVTVTVQSSAYPVYVTGAVLRPGRVMADRPMSALDAIMEAGGFDYTKANLKSVVVIRQDKAGTTKFTLNLKEVMDGLSEKPFTLKPADIVYVPEKFNWF
jgi:polysaccharide export outer membrane protein